MNSNFLKGWLPVGLLIFFVVGICAGAVAIGYLLFTSRTTTTAVPTIGLPTPLISSTNTATFIPTPTTQLVVPTETKDAGTPSATLIPTTDADIFAVRRPVPPILDGDLSDWIGYQGVSTPFIVEQQPSWNGSMDISSVWYIGWDDQALYFAVAVADDQLVQAYLAKFAYFGDSLELQFDTNLTSDYAPTVNEDDLQFIVSPGNFAELPADSFRFQGISAGTMVDSPITNIIVAASRTTNGYNLEFAIPWSSLNLTPSVGLKIGCALNINDNDTPGSQNQQELMLSHVATRKWLDPTSWGSLTLQTNP